MAAKRTVKAKGKAAAKKSGGRTEKKKAAASAKAPGKKRSVRASGAKASSAKASSKKKVAPKKASPKKPASKKASPKKASPKRASSKKAAAKKTVARKTAKKAPIKKVAKKAVAKKVAPKKVAPKKSVEAKTAKKSVEAKVAAQASTSPVAPSSTKGMLPPPRTITGKPTRKGGEVLTLIPARSSQTGAPSRPSGAGARPLGSKTRSSAPAARRGVTLVRGSSERPSTGIQSAALPIPVRKVEEAPTVEERFARIEKRLEALDERSRSEFYEMFDQAWVSHDSALEGNVYTRDEIQAGFSSEPILTDSSLQPAADEIRRHREAIEYVRDFGLRKRLPITVDVVKKIYLILHPSEGDLKTVKYRRDIPQHRLYFHEYAAPDKIAYKVRQIVDWIYDPETRKRGALRVAARVHYDLVRVFPFQTDSGKVSRLLMNLLLYRGGYPAAVIHAKERQNYYEALKGEPNRILRLVQDSVEDGLGSIEKLLDEQDARKRAFVVS